MGLFRRASGRGNGWSLSFLDMVFAALVIGERGGELVEQYPFHFLAGKVAHAVGDERTETHIEYHHVVEKGDGILVGEVVVGLILLYHNLGQVVEGYQFASPPVDEFVEVGFVLRKADDAHAHTLGSGFRAVCVAGDTDTLGETTGDLLADGIGEFLHVAESGEEGSRRTTEICAEVTGIDAVGSLLAHHIDGGSDNHLAGKLNLSGHDDNYELRITNYELMLCISIVYIHHICCITSVI